MRAVGVAVEVIFAAPFAALAAGHFAIFPAAIVYLIIGSWQAAWLGSTIVLWVALCAYLTARGWREAEGRAR